MKNPKITFKIIGDTYVTNEKFYTYESNSLMEALKKHIASEKKVQEILFGEESRVKK